MPMPTLPTATVEAASRQDFFTGKVPRASFWRTEPPRELFATRAMKHDPSLVTTIASVLTMALAVSSLSGSRRYREALAVVQNRLEDPSFEVRPNA